MQEPDNVTCSECGWSVRGGQWHYLWQKDPSKPLPPPPPPPLPPPPGMLPEQICEKDCCEDKSCVAFLYEAHSDSSSGGAVGTPRCWLKSSLDPGPRTRKKPAKVRGATPVAL